MTTIKSTAELNHRITQLKADLLAAQVIDTLADYYEGSGVEPRAEAGLQEKISQTLAIFLAEIK